MSGLGGREIRATYKVAHTVFAIGMGGRLGRDWGDVRLGRPDKVAHTVFAIGMGGRLERDWGDVRLGRPDTVRFCNSGWDEIRATGLVAPAFSRKCRLSSHAVR